MDDLRTRASLNRQQRIGLDLFDDLNQRIPRKEVDSFVQLIRAEARELDIFLEIHPQGSYRRGATSSGDCDMIVTHYLENKRLQCSQALVRRLKEIGLVTHDLSNADSEDLFLGVAKLPDHTVHRRLDLLFVPYARLGAALLHFTGNDIFNRSLRLLARKKGMTLSQEGLWEAFREPGKYSEAKKGRLIAAATEMDIFVALGVEYKPPGERNVCARDYGAVEKPEDGFSEEEEEGGAELVDSCFGVGSDTDAADAMEDGEDFDSDASGNVGGDDSPEL